MSRLLPSLGLAPRVIAAPVYAPPGWGHTDSSAVYASPQGVQSPVSSPSLVYRTVAPSSPSIVYRALSPESSPSRVRRSDSPPIRRRSKSPSVVESVASPASAASPSIANRVVAPSSPSVVHRVVPSSPSVVYRVVSPSPGVSAAIPPVPAGSSVFSAPESPAGSTISGRRYNIAPPASWAPLPGEVPPSTLVETKDVAPLQRQESIELKKRRAPPPFSPVSSSGLSPSSKSLSRSPSKPRLRRSQSSSSLKERATSSEPLHHTYSKTFRDGVTLLPGGRSSSRLSRASSRASSRSLSEKRDHPCHRLSRASTASFRMKAAEREPSRRSGGSKSRSASPSRSVYTVGWFPKYQPLQHGYVSKHEASTSFVTQLRDRQAEAPVPLPFTSKNRSRSASMNRSARG